MKDLDIRDDVLAELDLDPRVRASDVGVEVHHGVVTLSGRVRSFAEKTAAEQAAFRVRGVRAVAQELDVCLESETFCDDEIIALRIANYLTWNVEAPHDGVKVRVDSGWVTLEGEVDWAYQAADLEQFVRKLTGVKGLSNHVAVRSGVAVEDLKTSIRQALRRNADFDARHIDVDVDGHNVTLTGRVKAWSERLAARYACLIVPGVRQVNDRLVIQ